MLYSSIAPVHGAKKSLLLIIKKTNTMKKYIIACIIALVAMVTGVNVFHSNSELALSNIALANVEALANNESGGSSNCYWDRTQDRCSHNGKGSQCALVDEYCEPID